MHVKLRHVHINSNTSIHKRADTIQWVFFVGENFCNLLEYRFSWENYHQHVKRDSKLQVTSMAYVGYVASKADSYLYRKV